MVNKKTAVIGDPIDHSLSPKIHNHWIERERIDVAAYQKINIKKESLMGGLSVGQPSLVPWEILKKSVNSCI